MILRNLLVNAVKFTEKGQIQFDLTTTENNITIIAKDSGVGMTEAEIEKLLSPKVFTKKGTANESGTGIGVLLIKEFVIKMGGTLHIQSKVDEGTSFEISLPTKVS